MTDTTLRADLEPYFDALSAPTRFVRVLVADWGLAVLGAVSLLVLTAGAAILLSIAITVGALPRTVDLGRDAALGLGLVPSAFGATTAVSVGHGENFLGVQLACTAFPLMLYPALATAIFLRFVSAHLADDRRRLVAFAVKLALLSGGAAGGLAWALPSPHNSGQALSGFTVRTDALTAAVGAFIIVLIVSGYYVARRLWFVPFLADRRTATSALRSAVVAGIGAALALVILGFMIAVPAGVAASDTTHERVEFVSAVGATGLNLATDAGVLALGGRLRVGAATSTGASTSLDLWHFGAPPDGRRNPEGVRFLLVLAPLLALAAAASRLSRRIRAQNAWTAAGALFVLALTFTLAYGLFAVLARLNVAGSAPLPSRSGRLVVGLDLGSTLVHALVFALVVVGLVGVAGVRLRRTSPRSAAEGIVA